MNVINKHARLLTTAVETGQDPITVTLDDTSANKSKTGGILVVLLRWHRTSTQHNYPSPIIDYC